METKLTTRVHRTWGGTARLYPSMERDRVEKEEEGVLVGEEEEELPCVGNWDSGELGRKEGESQPRESRKKRVQLETEGRQTS